MRRWTIFAGYLLFAGCSKTQQPAPALPTVPLPTGVVLRYKSFHSAALERDVSYCVLSPSNTADSPHPRVVYLLHGNGGSYLEWSEYSPIAQLAVQGFTLIMPEGHSSYYMDSATNRKDRYEDFIADDLIIDAERDLRWRPERSDRAIVGASMGGFAAIDLGLKHPVLYSFAGGLSPAIDVAERAFSFRRLSQSLNLRSIFGPSGSASRTSNDPFQLVKSADPRRTPFIFLAVGRQEPLRAPVERFDSALRANHIPHEFHELPGGHDWQQWNEQLPALISALQSN